MNRIASKSPRRKTGDAEFVGAGGGESPRGDPHPRPLPARGRGVHCPGGEGSGHQWGWSQAAATAVGSLSRLRGRVGVGAPRRRCQWREFPHPHRIFDAMRPPPQAGEALTARGRGDGPKSKRERAEMAGRNRPALTAPPRSGGGRWVSGSWRRRCGSRWCRPHRASPPGGRRRCRWRRCGRPLGAWR